MIKFAEQFEATDDLLLLLSALAALLIGAFAIGMLFNDLSARADRADEAETRLIFMRPRQAVAAPEGTANDG